MNIGGPLIPHATFNIEKGFGLYHRTSLCWSTIRNILNDRYMVTFLNAQGNHYAAPREFEVGVRFH